MASMSAYYTSSAAAGPRKPLGKSSPLANSFSLIEYDRDLRFLIMDCPTNNTIALYLKEFARLNVTDVVRVCEPTYLRERLETHGVRVHDLPFKDGDVPPASVLKQWLELVNERLCDAVSESAAQPVPKTIAVHCVAGLGRAPVLVAVALIEKGMDPLDSIEHVRHKRRGAFNNRQITYLADQYKRTAASKHAKVRASPLNSTASPHASASPAGSGSAVPAIAPKSFFRKMFGSSH
ncbi:hypothetical protein H4R27_004694 [Coemansia aciculifera]|nr:hypothetical protein GGH93_005261 [Coemansia aciculifera]KAJ2880487.1 hypothetical protein H4R27_004694 [Coemansia aciculifera]